MPNSGIVQKLRLAVGGTNALATKSQAQKNIQTAKKRGKILYVMVEQHARGV